MWHSYGGKYCKYDELESHDILELDAYIHDCPIRRLVDLLVYWTTILLLYLKTLINFMNCGLVM